MTRARETSRLVNSETFNVDSDFNVGVNSTTPDAKFDVVGVLSATSFSGDGSNLTGINAGATLSAASGTQRLIVTSLSSGNLLQVATNSDLTYNSSTNTLSATQYSGTLLGNASGLQGTPSITVQDITAEQVSAAGTVSYSSVDNVSSVGIITANKGIKVPDYGVVVTGVVTATSFQGSASNLTGVEAGTHNFIASGAIDNGQTVVINTDGTVGIVTLTSTNTPSVTSPSVFYTGEVQFIRSTYDTANDKLIVVYEDSDNSDYGTAVVGTVSGDTITFGSPTVFDSSAFNHGDVIFEPNQEKVVVVYSGGNPDSANAKVGTVSGNSISFGSAVSVGGNAPENMSLVYDSNSTKIVLSYSEGNSTNNYRGRSVVGTVYNNGDLTWGSHTTYATSRTYYPTSTYDSTNNKVVVFYANYDSSPTRYDGMGVVGTVSGTSISFGTPVQFSSGQCNWITATFDSNNSKTVVGYRDEDNSSYGMACVGTVSGTSISYGTAVAFNSGNSTTNSLVYDTSNQKVIVSYRTSAVGYARVGSISGTSISFGSATTFQTATCDNTISVYDSTDNKVIISYKHNSDGGKGKSVLFSPVTQTTNLTSENYIGIAATTIANGSSGKITVIGGFNNSQSGLTTSTRYFVQTNGGISTTAGNPSVLAGTSVSSTRIAVQKT